MGTSSLIRHSGPPGPLPTSLSLSRQTHPLRLGAKTNLSSLELLLLGVWSDNETSSNTETDTEAHAEVTEPAQWLAGLFKVACGSMWESLRMQAREALQCCKQSVEDLSGGRA